MLLILFKHVNLEMRDNHDILQLTTKSSKLEDGTKACLSGHKYTQGVTIKFTNFWNQCC